MRGDILGLERRRKWDDEENLGIVLSVGADGATVTQVAQRHEVTRQNALVAGHDAGAGNWAIIASLIEACKMNVIDPHA